MLKLVSMLGLASGAASSSSAGSGGVAPGPVVAHEAGAETGSGSQPARMQVRGAHGKSTADLSHRQPPGCLLRRYNPATRSEFWFARLPRGVKDGNNRASKSLTWGFWSGRSEEEAVAQLEQWLADNHQRGASSPSAGPSVAAPAPRE